MGPDQHVVIKDKPIIGLAYDLADDNITAEVARTGKMAVIQGWDDRFDQDINRPDHPVKVSYFIPVKQGARVLAVLATGSTIAEKEQTLRRIEAMQPLLDQVAIALEHALQRSAGTRPRTGPPGATAGSGRDGRGHQPQPQQYPHHHHGAGPLLQRHTDEPRLLGEAEDIITATLRARDLVQHLHHAVKGGKEVALGSVRVNQAVQEAVQAAQPRWKDEAELRGFSIDVIARLEEVPPIKGTESGMHDILINLLFNAVDALPEGGTITMTTQAAEESVRMCVSDTGIGMDEETCRRVFEPFFTTKMEVGTGLGLSTVYGTVSRWGGRIEVESAPGRGTSFTLDLPAWSEPEVKAEAPGVVVGPVRRGRLWIVEDEEPLRRMLSELLSGHHEVELAASGREVLDRFAPGCCDVALIDLGIPGLPGDQLAQQMRQKDPVVVTVLITGWNLGPDDERLAAFDFWLQKPFASLAEIEDVVARAIELHDVRVESS